MNRTFGRVPGTGGAAGCDAMAAVTAAAFCRNVRRVIADGRIIVLVRDRFIMEHRIIATSILTGGS
jgi:hypothetical protein